MYFKLLVNFARSLVLAGYTVLRFDYTGHGDSDGIFEDSNVETRLLDIGRAVEIIREKTNVDRVGLLGLRLGATFGVLWAEKNDGIDALLLWEPVLNVRKYLLQCLRSNLTSQMSIYRKIKYTREQMIQDLEEGRPVNIDGYLMSGIFTS